MANQEDILAIQERIREIHVDPTESTCIGNNNALSLNSTSVGGIFNSASQQGATTVGGYETISSGLHATICGSLSSKASGNGSTVIGGSAHKASANGSTVIGGKLCTASGYCSTVMGGYNNKATGDHSTVLGGSFNSAEADHSTARGHYCRAINYGEDAHSSGPDSTISIVHWQGKTTEDCRELFLGGKRFRFHYDKYYSSFHLQGYHHDGKSCVTFEGTYPIVYYEDRDFSTENEYFTVKHENGHIIIKATENSPPLHWNITGVFKVLKIPESFK